jgi:predicted ATPase
VILTPDQRVRVFVSSTLEELAPERAAARRAIENVRLTPVMFELGARPHPPQELYSAYVDQSDVFVGIYGERYGWIAPEDEVSGLEHEFELGAGHPRLLYVKRQAPNREPRLTALVERIEREAKVSYRTFDDPEQLERLIEDDLALLLSEQFGRGSPGGIRAFLPAPVDRFVGREAELASLDAMLADPAARLVTVTGPGGVGKTRLALEAARRVSGRFASGAHFVSLSSVDDVELVPTAIYESLGAPRGASSPAAALVEALRNEELLLVVDNFEHLLPAGRELADLLERCAGLKALVTSQAVLNLRGERELRIDPLEQEDAVALFVDRAEAVSRSFRLGDHEDTVGNLCSRVDRVPLALELAAVQVRVLSPAAILERLESSPSWLAASGADVPDRQRTLDAVVDWSLGLLDDGERTLCLQAGVFRGGFTLEALTAVAGGDALERLGRLVESSLVRVVEVDGELRYTMLESIRTHAARRLEERGDLEETRERHASFFGDVIELAGPELRRAAQTPTLARLDREYDNIRAALDSWLQRGETERIVAAGWALLPYWLFRERLVEGRRRLAEARDRGGLGELARARSLAGDALLALFLADYGGAAASLTEAKVTVGAGDDPELGAVAALALGTLEAMRGDERGVAMLEEAQKGFARLGNHWGETMSSIGLAWALNASERDAPIELYESVVAAAGAVGVEAETLALGALGRRLALSGNVPEAKRTLADALERTVSLRVPVGTGLYVDLIGDLAAREGEDSLATRLSAAAEAFFASAGAEVPALAGKRTERLFALRERLGEQAYEDARAGGLALSLEEAVAAAQGYASS